MSDKIKIGGLKVTVYGIQPDYFESMMKEFLVPN